MPKHHLHDPTSYKLLAAHAVLAVLLLAAIAIAHRIDQKIALKNSIEEKKEKLAAMEKNEKVTKQGLDPERQAKLVHAREAFVKAGGNVDKYTDWLLLRFLLKCHWDGARANDMLRATAKWSVTSGAAKWRQEACDGRKMLDDPDTVRLLEHMPYLAEHYRDSMGFVQGIYHVGGYDPQSLWAALDNLRFQNACTRFIVYAAFEADRISEKEGRLVSRSILLDYQHLGMKHMHPYIFWQLRPIFANFDLHFPGYISRVCCANAPPLYTRLYSILSPWLSDELRASVVVSSPEDTPSALRAWAPKGNMPVVYGGSHLHIPDDLADKLGLSSIDADTRRRLFRWSKTLQGYANRS